jgi:membrane-bound lytic murein transglycosylase F
MKISGNKWKLWLKGWSCLWLFSGIMACQSSNPSSSNSADWDVIQQRDTLVVLMENSASTYFLFGDEEMGFDFDLIKVFAKEHQLHLKVKVMDDVDAMW